MDARAKFTACPSFQIWVPVCAVRVGAEGVGVRTANVSDVESPLVSVAVTWTLRPAAELATVPVKAPVVALNDNQDGNAAPLDSVAL